MPEIINTLFGRARNTTASTGEEVEPTVTATVEPTDDAIATEDVAEDIETAPSADDVVESTEGESTEQAPADSDFENSDDDAESVDVDEQADDEPAADEATIETDAEESDEAATDEEAAAEDTTEEAAAEVSDEDAGSAEDVEPVTAEADDAPVAAETADAVDDADTVDDADAAGDDADDVDQTEPVVVPVVVPAEARPAAGARGSVTVGEGVVAKVVNIVVGKVDGVYSLDDEGIAVELDDDVATVKVSLVVEYGHAIKALAEQIRVGVIEAVEQFLGLDVAVVDVHVSDIHAA